VTVYWTARAKSHLRSIYNYIAKDSPRNALLTVDRLTSRSKQIADFPKSGRKVPEYDNENIRELIEGNYRIIYHILSTQIDVIAVVHSARISF
jgi:toxin ParE1/3/4